MTTHLPFAFPIRVPDDVLVAFGEFTGLHWNDTYAMEPFVCEALRQYMQPPGGTGASGGAVRVRR